MFKLFFLIFFKNINAINNERIFSTNEDKIISVTLESNADLKRMMQKNNYNRSVIEILKTLFNFVSEPTEEGNFYIPQALIKMIDGNNFNYDYDYSELNQEKKVIMEQLIQELTQEMLKFDKKSKKAIFNTNLVNMLDEFSNHFFCIKSTTKRSISKINKNDLCDYNDLEILRTELTNILNAIIEFDNLIDKIQNNEMEEKNQDDVNGKKIKKNHKIACYKDLINAFYVNEYYAEVVRFNVLSLRSHKKVSQIVSYVFIVSFIMILIACITVLIYLTMINKQFLINQLLNQFPCISDALNGKNINNVFSICGKEINLGACSDPEIDSIKKVISNMNC